MISKKNKGGFVQDEIKLIMQISRGTLSRSWTDVLCVRTQLSLCAQLSSLPLGLRPTGLEPGNGGGDWVSEPACPSLATIRSAVTRWGCVRTQVCAQACVMQCSEVGR